MLDSGKKRNYSESKVVSIIGQVADISNVLDMADGKSFPLQVQPQGVPDRVRPCVTDVEVVVDRLSAGVETHFSLFNRPELFFFSRQSVVKSKRHSILECRHLFQLFNEVRPSISFLDPFTFLFPELFL